MNFEAELSGRRFLVTGGAGFVGSRIVSRLADAGADVRVLDDFSTGMRESLPDASTIEIVEGSVVDLDRVREALADRDTVIHAAARNIVLSTRNPRDDFEVNIGGTLNVLLAARDAGVNRIVYTSSASIYGNPRYLPIAEEDPVNLLSPYAVSKFAGEGYCHAFYESYSLPTAVVRYSNVFGLGQTPDNPYCGVVAKFFQAAIENQAFQIHGDGEQTRDYTYVDDAVTATLTVAVSPRAIGQAYNVGTGRETSVNQLARFIIAITGSDAEPQHVDRRDIDNIRRRVVNIEKIRRELRWSPEVTVEQGLQQTYAWIRERNAAARV
jgi:nucleoside-diphosphate-sugar epimerase